MSQVRRLQWAHAVGFVTAGAVGYLVWQALTGLPPILVLLGTFALGLPSGFYAGGYALDTLNEAAKLAETDRAQRAQKALEDRKFLDDILARADAPQLGDTIKAQLWTEMMTQIGELQKTHRANVEGLQAAHRREMDEMRERLYRYR